MVSEFRDRLSVDVNESIERIEHFTSIDSTNSYLLREALPDVGAARVAIADVQTDGRGSHGRAWLSERDRSLCMSVAWTFDAAPDGLSSLTLVFGVAVARALASLGLSAVRLKWPNDLMVGDAKLGGMLAETRLRADRSVGVIFGIGVNLRLPTAVDEIAPSKWASSPTSMEAHVDALPSRDAVAAAVLSQAVPLFRDHDAGSLPAVLDEWRRLDACAGRPLRVEQPDSTNAVLEGTGAGVDDSGALLVDTDNGLKRVLAGRIVRPTAT